MADSQKYRVILSGAVLPEKSRPEVIDNLVSLFHSQPETMEKLLLGKPVPLTREYDYDQAEKICRAIRDAGAECKMEEIGAPDSSAAPESGPEQRGPEQDQPSAAHSPQPGGSEDEAGATAGKESTEKESAEKEPTEKESALMRFVAVNTDYYRRQFARFGSLERPSFAVSWHWPAFFVFFFWAIYRKLWLWAGVNIAGGLILAQIVKPGIVYLMWTLIWPLTANYLYFRHACNRVSGRDNAEHLDDNRADDSRADDSRADDSRADDSRADDSRADSGGVSRAAVWLGLIIMFLFSVALNNILTERMMEQYSGQVGDVLPGAGAHHRGDGSIIEEGADLAPRVTTTLAILNTIAGTLKLAASEKALDDSQLALSVLQRIIEQKQVKDAWGTVISLRRDATGEVRLISAGPDGSFDTDDDILQYIRFDRL